MPNNNKIINDATKILKTINSGKIPEKLQVSNNNDEKTCEFTNAINKLIDNLDDINKFILPLSHGKLDIETPYRNNMLAAPFKELHANLKHLTWQTKQIAKGDLTQRVDFMGEFSTAFNKMINSLEDKNKLIAVQIEKLNNINRELDNEIQRFAYIASHNLREPIRTIISYNQLIDKRLQKIDDDNINDYLDFILKDSYKLNRMIEGLREYSDCYKMKKTFELFDLEKVVKDIVFERKDFYDNNCIEIAIEALPKINGDKLLFQKLVFILIDNSIKYRAQNNHKIKIYNCSDEANHIICFDDNGRGIRKEYTEKIFDIFYSLDSNDDSIGLGLALARQIMRTHGGKIWVESSLGSGAKFYILLPKNL